MIRFNVSVTKFEEKHLYLKFAFVVFVSLLSSRFWTFHGIPDFIYGGLEVITSLVLLFIFLCGFKQTDFSQANFSGNITVFIVMQFLSIVAAYLFHDQSFQLSLLMSKTVLFWLLYFVLHIYGIPAKWLINTIVIVGVIWAVLTVVQQFTYPNFYFYVRDNLDGTLQRAGVYRFMPEPKNYGLFLVLYCFTRAIRDYKWRHILFTLLGLVGFYFYGTRQYAVSALCCMMIASVMQPGKKRIYSIFIICIAIGTLFILRESLFSSYIEITNDQLQDDDDVRILAAKYFLFDYWPSWLTFIFGNGRFHLDSSYGKEMDYLRTTIGYYREDIGIIGALNYFGIIYAINVIYLFIKGTYNKFFTQETQYLKLIFINFFIVLFLSDEYSSATSCVFICFICYLVDQSYFEKKIVINHAKFLKLI